MSYLPWNVDVGIALISLFVFVGTRSFHNRLCCGTGSHLLWVIGEVLSGLLFLAYTYLISKIWPNSSLIPFLWDFSLLYLGISFVDSIFALLPVSKKTAAGRIAKGLFGLSFLVSLFISYGFYPSHWFSSPVLRQLLILLGGLVLVLGAMRYISNSIVRYGIAIGYLLFALFWWGNWIVISLWTVSSLFCLVFVSLGYAWLVTDVASKVHSWVVNRLSLSDANEVVKGFRFMMTALYLYSIEAVWAVFSGVDVVQTYLSPIYLVKSSMVQINLYRLYRSVLVAIFVLGLLRVVKKLVKAYFPEDRREFEGASAETVVFNLGILVVIILIMASLGITWRIVLPVAGTLGIGIGFGLQTIMNNYMSGFILLFSQKIRVGDIVEVSVSTPTLGQTNPTVFGKVEEIGILATTIRTNDGVDIAIPNSNFINSPIINYSHRDSYVRYRLPVGVSYASDPNQVREIILETISEIKGILRHPEPRVWFYEYGDSAIIFVATFWFDIRRHIKINRLRDEFYTLVWYKLKDAGIEIPFIQNDVWFRNKLEVRLDKGGEG